jgi:uncharacterized membrane protein
MATISSTENITRGAEVPRMSARQLAQRCARKDVHRVARGLGWFSIGLGLTELMAPRAVGRLIGTRNHSSILRGYGLRELAAGVGILSTARPAGWVWSRVAGDVVDLASLARAMGSERNQRGKTALGLAAVAGVTAVDIWCARQLSADTGTEPVRRAQAEASIIVNRSPEECYRFWRDLENLPRFLSYVEQVRTTGDRTSHWVAKLPGGSRMEWDAEVVEDLPGQAIRWRALPGSELPHSGTVEFDRARGNRGTIVRVQMDFGETASPFRVRAALWTGRDPIQILHKELRRFKQAIETGEVITTEGQPAGRRSSVTWLDKIAR